MRADKIEPAVWAAISKAVTNPKILTAHILGLAKKTIENEKNLKQEQKSLLQERESIDFKKKKLDELYFKGLKSIEDYENQIKEFRQEEDKVNERLKEIENKAGQLIDRSLVAKEINYFCGLAKQKIKKLNPEERQKLLRYLVEEILLDSNSGKAKITGYIPIQEQDLDHLFSQTNFQNQVQVRPLSTVSNLYASH